MPAQRSTAAARATAAAGNTRPVPVPGNIVLAWGHTFAVAGRGGHEIGRDSNHLVSARGPGASVPCGKTALALHSAPADAE